MVMMMLLLVLMYAFDCINRRIFESCILQKLRRDPSEDSTNLHHSDNDSRSSNRNMLPSAYFQLLQQYLLAHTTTTTSGSSSRANFHSPRHDTNVSSREGGDKGQLSLKAKRIFTALR